MKTKTLAPNSSSVAKRLGSYGKKMKNGGSLNEKSTNPKKPVVKKTTKDSKTISQRIGDITLRDVKNAGEDALQLATLGGYGKIKKALGGEYKYKEIGEKKYGGKINKAKNGTSLGMKSVKAGYDKNPGVTRADIIVAAKKEAKKGMKVKKAQDGFRATNKQRTKGSEPLTEYYPKINRGSGNLIPVGAKKNPKTGKPLRAPKQKAGGMTKKCAYGCK